MSFRDNLIHLRTENNLTQERLAVLLGVSRQSVTKWESEKSYPEMDKLIKMCQLFGCTLDDLVQGDLTDREVSTQIQAAIDSEPADVFGYDEHMNRFSTKIATGVVCPIIGVAIGTIFFALGPNNEATDIDYLAILPENISAALGLLFIFLGVLACLSQVIPAGLAHSDFVKAHPYIEDFYTTEQRSKIRESFSYQLVTGIFCIFIGVFLMVFLAETRFETVLGIPLMLFAIAIGVFFIVHGSIRFGKTNINNYNLAAGEVMTASEIASLDLPDDHKEKLTRYHNQDKRKGSICGMIMLVATIVGLVMLFVPGYQNNLFWLAWPIGGIMCGFVALLMNAISGSPEE